jgi:hypothetical protein
MPVRPCKWMFTCHSFHLVRNIMTTDSPVTQYPYQFEIDLVFSKFFKCCLSDSIRILVHTNFYFLSPIYILCCMYPNTIYFCLEYCHVQYLSVLFLQFVLENYAPILLLLNFFMHYGKVCYYNLRSSGSSTPHHRAPPIYGPPQTNSSNMPCLPGYICA